MWQVILGRAVSGAGSSAMVVVAALLISGTRFSAEEYMQCLGAADSVQT